MLLRSGEKQFSCFAAVRALRAVRGESCYAAVRILDLKIIRFKGIHV